MKRVLSAIRDFLQLEAASSVVLLAAALAALALANSPLAARYDAFLNLPVEVRIGVFDIAKPLLLWVNDGLMALFFFLVGLEIKREVLQGELSTPSQIALPAIAAAGGMAVPAIIYAALNAGDPIALRGWAIPAATDIAFALGVLALLGDRVPQGLKMFLLTLAILDDLGAIVIIALFYTERLSPPALGVAALAMAALALLNRGGVQRIAPYLLLGVVLWAAVLKSSVHATLAGVALAFFIPSRIAQGERESPLERLERDLHPSVAFGVLPLFGFANAGVPLEGVTLASLAQPVPAGIAAGLLLGKTAGVFGFAWLALKLKLARLPEGVDWRLALGAAVLCGIGFTMSLFIASLAFPDEGSLLAVQGRLGILAGSCLSAVLGYAILRWALGRIR